ncbi:hypothetical protein [Amycolatopsis thermophila]|uniref:Uncharacterized protein n=1 Tax=Amycolatopsis thermophila TaxID=206084 RepID=A0ABU0EMM4_9PSEU|nr:hypothetical protein [Amycolatopsis thermophila]MDQ0376533.1 hypothetical protein [Amycolatopsis thermophila]
MDLAEQLTSTYPISLGVAAALIDEVTRALTSTANPAPELEEITAEMRWAVGHDIDWPSAIRDIATAFGTTLPDTAQL